jgi:hypothetical protein
MGNRNGIVSIAVAGLLCAMAVDAAAQEKSRHPDWFGQWSRVPDGGVPRYDPTKPIRKQEAPLKPEYQARFEASMRDQDLGGMGLDMAYSCRPPGMPRMMSGVALMEFLISPGVTHILFDRNDYAPRRIYTDGREWPKIGIDDTTFPGYSIGEWVDKDGAQCRVGANGNDVDSQAPSGGRGAHPARGGIAGSRRCARPDQRTAGRRLCRSCRQGCGGKRNRALLFGRARGRAQSAARDELSAAAKPRIRIL